MWGAMGAEVTKLGGECGCVEGGFLGMCAPQDPQAERSSQIETRPAATYPSEREARVPDDHREVTNGDGGGRAYGDDDEDVGGFAPPPPSDGLFAPEPMGGVAAPTSLSRDAGTTSSTPAPPPASMAPGAGSVDLQRVLEDLEGSEEQVYGDAFSSIAGGATSLTPDHALLREFIATNTALPQDDLETALLTSASASDAFVIDKRAFVQLLRDNAISENACLEQFVGMTSDGETITSEECRSGLLYLIQQQLASSFSDQRSELLFDTVMVSAGITVSMEQWVVFSKTLARMVRLLRYAQL